MKHLSYLTRTNNDGWEPFLAWDPISVYEGGDVADCLKFIKEETSSGRTVVGYISYDIGYQLLKIKQNAKDVLGLPQLYFLSYENNNINEVDSLFDKNAKLKNFDLQLLPTMSKEKYFEAFKKIKEYIKTGHVYQINFTQQLVGKTNRSARELFAQIIARYSAGYLAYIEGAGFEILSASPEHFIKTKNGLIQTWPVKGTRPRGKTKDEDERLRQDLLTSKKEQAELDMITDLLRNDIGKISDYGTVEVKERRIISQYPTLFHASSHIQGELKKSITPIEALFSMFPGGSVTGVPKKRAMEIIAELEPTNRGIYCGAIGIVDENGDIDFNIAIRTLIKRGNEVYLSVGAGIVYDSDANSENQEMLDKAKTFIF